MLIITYNLEEIGRQEFTEKSTHGYLPIYERLWKPIQNEPITLLEIGIYNGNSLRTWCRWFPKATIVGIESNPANPMRTDRAGLHFGDQSDVEFLQNVANAYNGFDIIIDDGSHKWKDQQISLEVLWPHVKPGGMYIIEDLHTSNDPFWQKENEPNTVECLKDLVTSTVLFTDTEIFHLEFYSKLAILHKRV